MLKNWIFGAVLPAALVLGGCAADGETKPEEDPYAYVIDLDKGPNCLQISRVRNTKVLDDQTILFEMAGGDDFVNRLPRRCPSLGFEKRFAFKSRMNQYCSQDTITVITSMGPAGVGRGATCGLGAFHKWTPPEEIQSPNAEGRLEAVE